MMSEPAAGLGVEDAQRGAEPADAVGPLMRGMSVIRALTEAGGAQSLPELSREVGLARATLDRVLATLESLGYVRFHRKEAVLTPRLMELGNAYLHSVRIPTLLGPLAQQLSERLDEIVTLTVTQEDGAYVVQEAVRPRKLVIVCHVGDRLPVDRCAGGVLFAATWDEQRWERYAASHACTRDDGDSRACAVEMRRRVEPAQDRGYVLDDQWLEPGLVAVGMPVYGPDGAEACTANVLSFTTRHSTAAELADAVIPALRESVRAMERALRSTPRSATKRTESPPRVHAGPGAMESFARGLAVLGAFSESQPSLSIADGSRATGLPRATVRRALITLEHLGYVRQVDGHYQPTASVLSLGYPVLTRLTLAQIAATHLEALSSSVNNSASMAVLHDDTEIVYVGRAATAARLMSVDIQIGSHLPAYATAMGRVLLAQLPVDQRTKALRAARPQPLTPQTVTDRGQLLQLLRQVEEDGYAVVDEELEIGLRSVAVPVPGHDGKTIAAINVAMHADRDTAQDITAAVLPYLRSAAQAIHQDLAIVGPFHRLSQL